MAVEWLYQTLYAYIFLYLGIALRKVEATNESKVEEKPSTFHDVASILARRVAVEMSDSESGSSEYDSDGWDEASAWTVAHLALCLWF